MAPGNRLGTRLSRLVRARAYLVGNHPVLEKRIQALKADLAAARSELKKAKAEIIRIDAQIVELSQIDPGDIRPIRSVPREETRKHGELRRELIDILRKADGPISTKVLVVRIAERFQLPLATPDERRRARTTIQRPLCVFAARGVVVRLPSTKGDPHGIWLWTGC